jgi:hypothetical protein
VPLPRVRFWPDERGLLVGLSFGDAYGDPIVGVDLWFRGRVGQLLSRWAWDRRRRRRRG